MLRKILSGGQTGADQGALDAAIRLGIPHGGWVPKGRKTETGRLPDRYSLRESPSGRYADRTERNVLDADGTVIISHGSLSGGSELTRKMAIRHNRPWIHIDLNHNTKFQASMVLSKWVKSNRIEVLNVAGPRASHDPDIYNAVAGIIESAFFLLQIKDRSATEIAPASAGLPMPRSVEEAVSRLLSGLSLKDKATIANMAERELDALRKTLGDYVETAFGLLMGNDALLASCRFVSRDSSAEAQDAAMVIVHALWKNLRGSHRLRVVK